MIPYGKQYIDEEDINAVIAVLRSDFITQGPVISQFESSIKQACNVEFVTAVNSATSALHLACRAVGLGPGDWLWTSPISFVASSNVALFCGAQVDFVDIDPETFNMAVDALETKLEAAEKTGRLPKVVMPVHFGGEPCDLKKIYALSKKYNFYVIEDASHAIGGSYQGSKIGSCKYSDLTVFSFHPVKIITTGEGGVCTTNNPKFAEKLTILRSHGVTRDTKLMNKESEGPWYYQQVELGYNYRMTDIQAALGASQMKKLDSFVAKRHELAAIYDHGFQDVSIQTQKRSAGNYSGLHLYPIKLIPEQNTKTRLQVFNELREKGVGVNVLYIPIHTQPYYQKLGFQEGQFPHAEAYYKGAISLPLFPTLTCDEQQYVILTVKDILQ